VALAPSEGREHALAAALPQRYSAIVYLAAGCGLRGAEITGLELGAVDFLQREIDVSQQLVCVTGVEPYLGPPKTRSSAHTVEMPAVTIASPARHIELFPPPEVEIWDRTDPDQRKHYQRTARLLFVTRAGRPIHRATWAHLWAPAARQAGIPRGIGLHCLRHYFATLLIHHGAGVKRVQLALGHSTPMITLNTYEGEWPDTDDHARAIVDYALGDVPCTCPARRTAR
jgi:integrase